MYVEQDLFITLRLRKLNVCGFYKTTFSRLSPRLWLASRSFDPAQTTFPYFISRFQTSVAAFAFQRCFLINVYYAITRLVHGTGIPTGIPWDGTGINCYGVGWEWDR